MTDITPILLKYRDALRGLWNGYFIERNEDSDSFAWEVDLYFEKIKKELFKALVSTKVFDREIELDGKSPIDRIKIIPNLGPKGYMASYASVVDGNSTTWEHIWIKTEGNDFRMIDFFDWTTEKVMECENARVRLVESKEFPNLVGTDFLFDAWNVKYIKTSANIE